MLNEIRLGQVSEETKRIFKKLERRVEYADGLEPTCLYATAREVSAENNSRLKRLRGEATTFFAKDLSAVRESANGTTCTVYPYPDTLQSELESVRQLRLHMGQR